MSDERLPPDADPAALRVVLSELGRGLDSIRDRLARLERHVAGAGPAGRGPDEAGGHASARTLAAVQEILSIPSAGLQPGEFLALAIDRVSRLLEADRAMLFLAGARGDRLVPRSAHGFRRDDLEAIAVPVGEGIVGRAFAERRVLTHEAAAARAGEDPFIDRFPVRDAVAVPVRVDEEVAGILYAGRRGPAAGFSTGDVLVLLVAADRVAEALVRETLLARRGAQLARLAALDEFAIGIPVGGAAAEVLGRACEVGCRLLGVRAAAVATPAGPDLLQVMAASGLPPGLEAPPIDIRAGLTAEVYESNAPVACRDLQARRTAEATFLGDAGLHGCLGLPLRIRGAAAGVLYLCDTEARDFSAEEIQAAQVLASLTGIALESARALGALGDALDRARADRERLVQSERVRAVAELAAGLTREFNTVFASIVGKSQLLLARAQDEALREGLGVIEEAAWRGADIVNRLAGLVPSAAEGTPVDLATVVQDVIALARTRWQDAEGRGVPIDVVTEFGPAPLVEASPTALREVAMTLLLNAVDAMPGGGELRLAIREREGGVELVAEDTGEGISEDARRRVFDAFFTSRPVDRLGLGLTVAQAIVTRSGGRIEIAGGRRGGTAVAVWLPGLRAPAAPPPGGPAGGNLARPVEPPTGRAGPDVEPVHRGDPDMPAPAAAPWVPASEALTILVLEDEEPVRSMLVDALTQAGYRVEAVADGQAGLALVQARRFDLVLTDLALPQRSGLAVARHVKRMSPQTPVVLITGWAHLLDPERLREHGVDLMLVKPFGLERVLAVVGDALRLRSTA
jgi:signal transduction histidine kinase/CheY-like chemotaxis protein